MLVLRTLKYKVSYLLRNFKTSILVLRHLTVDTFWLTTQGVDIISAACVQFSFQPFEINCLINDY